MPSGSPRSRWTLTQDGSIRTRYWPCDCSTHRPLVLVHGVIASSRYLLPVGSILAPDYRVLIPDLPGYGRSTSTMGRLSVPALAGALVHWMEAVALESASFLANSFGCQIAANLAARYPTRVDRLILAGPSVDPHAHSLPVQALRLAHDYPHERLSLSIVLGNDCIDMGIRQIRGSLRAMMDDRIEKVLPLVLAPTLVVRGQRDTVVPQRWAEEACSLLPNGRLEVLPGAPHAANYSAPYLLAAAARRFLAESLHDE